MPLNFDAMQARVLEQCAEVMTGHAASMAARAKTLAPIRKIFKGGKRTIRFKTATEVEADIDLRRSLGLGPEIAKPPNLRASPYRASPFARRTTRGDTANMDVPSQRVLARPGMLRSVSAAFMLSRQGAYELRSGRADYEGSVGGRLRGEIYSTPAESLGSMLVAKVVSPTPYAKYQEFGTRHHPAQPFLRPALHEGQQRFVRDLNRAVKRASKGIGREVIRVTVKPVVR